MYFSKVEGMRKLQLTVSVERMLDVILRPAKSLVWFFRGAEVSLIGF
jgi:hypothetical protein